MIKCNQCKKVLKNLEEIGNLGTYNHKKWFLCKGCSQIVNSFLMLSKDTKEEDEKNKAKVKKYFSKRVVKW